MMRDQGDGLVIMKAWAAAARMAGLMGEV